MVRAMCKEIPEVAQRIRSVLAEFLGRKHEIAVAEQIRVGIDVVSAGIHIDEDMNLVPVVPANRHVRSLAPYPRRK